MTTEPRRSVFRFVLGELKPGSSRDRGLKAASWSEWAAVRIPPASHTSPSGPWFCGLTLPSSCNRRAWRCGPRRTGSVSRNSSGSTEFGLRRAFKTAAVQSAKSSRGRSSQGVLTEPSPRAPSSSVSAPGWPGLQKTRRLLTRISVEGDKEAAKTLPIVPLLTISKGFTAGQQLGGGPWCRQQTSVLPGHERGRETTALVPQVDSGRLDASRCSPRAYRNDRSR